jgi:hypothetical protein
VTLRPAPEAQILAWWSSAMSAGSPQEVAVVRTGNVLFTGLDLFATPNDTPAVRQLFMWMLEQMAPNLAYEQARTRAAAMMAAVIRADAQVTEAERQFPNVSFAPVRQALEQARDAATQGKERVVQDRYRESGAAIEVARTALDQALMLLKKLTTRAR